MNNSFVIMCAFLILALGPDDGDASPVSEKFVVHASEMSSLEGESLTLICVLSGLPPIPISSPSYEWIKNGKVIQGETVKTFTIPRLSNRDNGNYQCGPPGSDVPRETFHLNVRRGAPVNGTFYVEEFGSSVMGRPMTLRCYQHGFLDTDLSIYVWTKDGILISGETGKTLTLQSLTKQDEGDYQCGAPGHDYPKRIHHVKVFSRLPQPVIFKDKLPVLGRTSSLNCLIITSYSMNSNMVYTWYKDSAEITGETGPVLTFPNVTEADAGVYTCTVRDGHVFTTSPSSSVYQMIPFVTPEIHIKSTHPGSVVKGILGEQLTLTCEVTKAFPNVPTDGYRWSFIPSTQDQPRHLLEKTRSLTLGPLTNQDSGHYQCQARNNQAIPALTLIGRASINLEVVYLENMHLTLDQEVSEGDSVNLTCGVESYPEAHLAWIVHGQEVRQIVGQRDQYYIHNVTCLDSTNYTCRASNADMPGREKNMTTQVIVDCKRQSPTEMTPYGTTQTGVSAPFKFPLPKEAAMMVVNPHGKDIIAIYRNCSYVITPEFLHRVHEPHCIQASHHFFFTLSQVTTDDEGMYLCREVESQRKTIPNCKEKLVVQREASGASESGNTLNLAVGAIALAVLANILLYSFQGRKIYKFLRQKWGSLTKFSCSIFWRSHLTEQQRGNISLMKERCESLESLYKSGKVYVFPNIFPPEQQATASNEEEARETTRLLAPGSTDDVEENEYGVKDRVRITLQQFTGDKDLPSFLLHNTRLSSKESIILTLSRKLGVVVMIVKAVADEMNLRSFKETMNNLLQARRLIGKKLKGFVTTEMIKAALIFVSVSGDESEEVRKRRKSCRENNVDLLVEMKKEDYQRWAKELSSRPDSQVWDLSTPGVDSPDSAFKMAASHLLSLTGCCPPELFSRHRSAWETWLLTPEQMEVRDSTAKLLHVSGPPGSGKTTLLLYRARQWLIEGKAVILAVGREAYDVLLAHIINAVRKDLAEEIQEKIRICRKNSMLELAMTELRGQNICLIIDTLREPTLCRSMLQAVRDNQITEVWSVCRDNLQTINKELSREARDLGWENIHLPVCMRCTDNTVELLNQLQQGSSDLNTIDAGSVPRTRNIPPWAVVDHCLHLGQASSSSSCVYCKSELVKLQPVGYGLDWNDWIALGTGDPKVPIDIKFLSKTLQSLGVPASFDEVNSVVASHGTQLDSAESEVARWLERVAAGVNEEGNPTVHVVRIHDIGGVEKKGVLLVHWDARDNDPNCQTEGDRETRLNEHRRQWIRTVASSKGQVILLLLTPSPARSLLNLQEPTHG